MQKFADNLTKAFAKVEQQQASMAAKTGQSTAQMGAGFQSLQSSVTRLTSHVQALAAAFGVTLGAGGLVAVARNMTQTAAAFENLDIRLRFLLGSLEEFNKARQFILDFARTTPLQIDQVAHSFAQLRAAGLDATKVLPVLVDAMSGVGGGNFILERLVLNFQQIAASGKLVTRELRDMSTTGLPVFRIFAEEAKRAGINIRGGIGEAAIEATQAIDLLLKGIEREFKGATLAMSTSFTVLISNVVDNWKIFSDTLMRTSGVLDFLKGAVSSLLQEMDRQIKENKDAFRDWGQSAIVEIEKVALSLAATIDVFRGFIELIRLPDFVNFLRQTAKEEDNLIRTFVAAIDAARKGQLNWMEVILATPKELAIQLKALGIEVDKISLAETLGIPQPTVAATKAAFATIRQETEKLNKQREDILSKAKGFGLLTPDATKAAEQEAQRLTQLTAKTLKGEEDALAISLKRQDALVEESFTDRRLLLEQDLQQRLAQGENSLTIERERQARLLTLLREEADLRLSLGTQAADELLTLQQRRLTAERVAVNAVVEGELADATKKAVKLKELDGELLKAREAHSATLADLVQKHAQAELKIGSDVTDTKLQQLKQVEAAVLASTNVRLSTLDAEKALIEEQVRGERITKQAGLDQLRALQAREAPLDRQRLQEQLDDQLRRAGENEALKLQLRADFLEKTHQLDLKQQVEQLKLLNEETEAWRNAMERIQGFAGDFFFDFMDGKIKDLGDLWDRTLELMKRGIADLVAYALTKPIIVPMIASVVGPALGAISPAMGAQIGQAAGPGGTSSILNQFGSLGSALQSFGGSLGSAVGAVNSFVADIPVQIGNLLGMQVYPAGFVGPLPAGATQASFGAAGTVAGIGAGAAGIYTAATAPTTAGQALGGVSAALGFGSLIPGPQQPFLLAASVITNIVASLFHEGAPSMEFGVTLGEALISEAGKVTFQGLQAALERNKEGRMPAEQAEAGRKAIEDMTRLTLQQFQDMLNALPTSVLQGMDLQGGLTTAISRANEMLDRVQAGSQEEMQDVVQRRIPALLFEAFHPLFAEAAGAAGDSFAKVMAELPGAFTSGSAAAMQQAVQRFQAVAQMVTQLTEIIEGTGLTPAGAALRQLDQQFAGIRASAQDLGVSMTLVDQAYAVQKTKLIDDFLKPFQQQIDAMTLAPLTLQLRALDEQTTEARKAAGELGIGTEEIDQAFGFARQTLVDGFLEPFRTTIDRLKLPPVIAQLKQLDKEFADARQAAGDMGSELAEVEEAFTLSRQEIIDGFLDPFQRTIEEFTLPPVVRQIQDLQREFEEASEAAMQLGQGMEEVALAFELAQQAAINDFLQPIQDQIAELTMEPLTFQLQQLEQEFEEARATAAALGVGVAEVETAFALAQEALIADFQQPITDALARLGDMLDQLTLSGATAADQVAFFESRIAALTTELAQVETTDQAIQLTEELAQATLDRYEAEVQALEELRAEVEALQGAQERLQDATDQATLSLMDSAEQVVFYQRRIDELTQQLGETEDIEAFVSLTDELIAATQARADAEIAAIEAIEQSVMAGIGAINTLTRVIDDLRLSGMESADQVTYWNGQIDALSAAFAAADMAGQVELTQDLTQAIQARFAAEAALVQEEVELQRQAAEDLIAQLTAVQDASAGLDDSLRQLALDLLEPQARITSLTTEVDALRMALDDQSLSIDEQIALVDEISRVAEQRYQEELAFITDIQTQTEEATRAIEGYTAELDTLRQTIDDVVKSINEQIFQLNLATLSESDRLTALQTHVDALIAELEAGLMGGQLATDDALALLGDSRDAVTDLIGLTDQMLAEIERTGQESTQALSLDELEALRTGAITGLEDMVDLLDAMGATGLFSADALQSLKTEAVLTLQALDAAGHTQSELLSVFETVAPAIDTLVLGTSALLQTIATEASLRETFTELAAMHDAVVGQLQGVAFSIDAAAGLTQEELTAIRTDAIAELEHLIALSEQIYDQGAQALQDQIAIQEDILATLGDQLEVQFGTRDASEAMVIAANTLQGTLTEVKGILDAEAADLRALVEMNPLITDMQLDVAALEELERTLMEPHLAAAEAELIAIQETLATSILTELEALGVLPTVETLLGTGNTSLAVLETLLGSDGALGALQDLSTQDELATMFEALETGVLTDTVTRLNAITALVNAQLVKLTGTEDASQALLKIEQDILAARQKAYDEIAALKIPQPVPFPTTIDISTLPPVTVANPVTTVALSSLPSNIGTQSNPMIVAISSAGNTVAISSLPQGVGTPPNPMHVALTQGHLGYVQGIYDRLAHAGQSVAYLTSLVDADLFNRGGGFLAQLAGVRDPGINALRVQVHSIPAAQHGLAEVPEEGIYHLHAGEMVLPASIATPLRRGAHGAGAAFSPGGSLPGAMPTNGAAGGHQEVHLHFHMEGAIMDQASLQAWTETQLAPVLRAISRRGITIVYDTGIDKNTRGRAA